MIKVNLLIEATPAAGAQPGASSSPSGFENFGGIQRFGGVSNFADIVIKIACVFVPLFLIMGYEQFNITSKNNEKNELTAKAQQLKEQTEQLKPEIEASKKLQEEKNRLQTQIDTIRKLSKERLYYVKSLSAIQAIIPTKLWLTDLKMGREKIELKGKSADYPSVVDFMKRLDDSIYFMNVRSGTIETIKTSDGSNQSFTIECDPENM